ncbi:hypothetical protein N7523_001190 [Penicillium sp. IBT 18751x]|nr:hypothetical protein N7523_001190 [Penicillium sp. IBT 18751x]
MDASVDSTGRPLFRSHKALPRRGIAVPSVDDVQPVSPDHHGTVTAAPVPPLTPPEANQQEGIENDSTPPKADSLSESLTAGMLTPRRPSKPPTPDVTPPRANSAKRPTLNNFVHLSSSSRADSFQTACESVSSDGDMETLGRSSSIASKKIRPRVLSSRRTLSNEVRAKLTYAKESPQISQPHSETEYETGFESFDGEWTSPKGDGSPTPLAGKRKGSETRNRPGQKQATDNETLDVQHLNASLMREKSLRDHVHITPGPAITPSMEQFREDIGWPSSYDPPFRGLSSTSTVEAMIIDSPRQAQRCLRHTEKRNSLRSASSPITKSERTSTTSHTDSQRRLVHKAARISESDRRSISSDVSFSVKTASSAPPSCVTRIPVVVVPERKSSLKSGPNSQVSSRQNSQRSNQRPPVTSKSPADALQQRQRAMSDSVPASSRGSSSRGRFLGRPVIPSRSSSLSAPTSRTNSRTASLTSESLRSHTLAMDLELQKRRDQQPVSPPRHNILGVHSSGLLEPPKLPGLVVTSSEDVATLRPPSLPYTQWSIPSSSPGPVEIHEAKAVSLFPHNNRSLLLVDQRVPGELQPVRVFQDGITDREAFPQTPVAPIGTALMLVHSPLKNPRPPPKPPIGKPLPPIPTQKNQAVDHQIDDVRAPGRWGSVRRTWAARPRSDSFNTLVRSLSVRSAKNRTAGVDMDSRLHPFWRPRGFWDDGRGSPVKDRSGRQSPLKRDNSMVVNNSLGLPQHRVIIEGPAALARRSPEMRRLFHASHASLVRTGSPLYPTRYHALSQWGRRLRSMSLRNTRARLRRIRQRRDERKQAARRENLKQSIGFPVYVASSATNEVVR